MDEIKWLCESEELERSKIQTLILFSTDGKVHFPLIDEGTYFKSKNCPEVKADEKPMVVSLEALKSRFNSFCVKCKSNIRIKASNEVNSVRNFEKVTLLKEIHDRSKEHEELFLTPVVNFEDFFKNHVALKEATENYFYMRQIQMFKIENVKNFKVLIEEREKELELIKKTPKIINELKYVCADFTLQALKILNPSNVSIFERIENVTSDFSTLYKQNAVNDERHVLASYPASNKTQSALSKELQFKRLVDIIDTIYQETILKTVYVSLPISVYEFLVLYGREPYHSKNEIKIITDAEVPADVMDTLKVLQKDGNFETLKELYETAKNV